MTEQKGWLSLGSPGALPFCLILHKKLHLHKIWNFLDLHFEVWFFLCQESQQYFKCFWLKYCMFCNKLYVISMCHSCMCVTESAVTSGIGVQRKEGRRHVGVRRGGVWGEKLMSLPKLRQHSTAVGNRGFGSKSTHIPFVWTHTQGWISHIPLSWEWEDWKSHERPCISKNKWQMDTYTLT